METVQITNEKLNKFVLAAKHYISKNNANKSLLWITLETLLPLAVKKLKKVEQRKDLTRVKYCKKDKSQYIEYDKKGGYQFTEENYKKLVDDLENIDNDLVEMPTSIVSKYPQKGLSYDLRDAFKGIVIPVDEYNVKGLDPEALQKMLDSENTLVAVEEEEEETVEE